MRHPSADELDRIGLHLDLESGFWLGLVAAADPAYQRLCREQARAQCLRRGLEFHLLTTGSQDVEALIAAVLRAGAGITWISSQGEAGLDHTRSLLLALNERREALQRTCRGGVVLAGPPALKADLRVMAPDLFTIRAFVIEPPALDHLPGLEPSRALAALDELQATGLDPDEALERAASLGERTTPGARRARLRALVTAVSGLRADDRDHEAEAWEEVARRELASCEEDLGRSPWLHALALELGGATADDGELVRAALAAADELAGMTGPCLLGLGIAGRALLGIENVPLGSDEQVQLAHRGLAVLTALHAASPGDARWLLACWMYRFTLGYHDFGGGDEERAVVHLAQAEQLAARLIAGSATDAYVWAISAITSWGLGSLLLAREDHPGALAALLRCVDHHDHAISLDPEMGTGPLDLAGALELIGMLLDLGGDGGAQPRRHLERALEIRASDRQRSPSLQTHLAYATTAQRLLMLDPGDPHQARGVWRSARESICAAIEAEEPLDPSLVEVTLDLAEAASALRLGGEAVALAEHVLSQASELTAWASQPEELAERLAALATWRAAQGPSAPTPEERAATRRERSRARKERRKKHARRC
ncbi:MAG: hypothetical protein ABIO70_36950 [Pseudomonadota bacterium]